jgi:Lipocalin-like domain
MPMAVIYGSSSDYWKFDGAATIHQRRQIMKVAALVGAIVLVTSVKADAQVDQLYGTWRLLSWTRQVVATGESVDSFGKAPNGFLTYGRDGRMSAIIVRANRLRPADLAKLTDQERAELYKTMVAYAGTFKVDGARVIHNVDISWSENWTGTAQVRNFRIDGRKLIISVDPQVGVDGQKVTSVLMWEKVE